MRQNEDSKYNFIKNTTTVYVFICATGNIGTFDRQLQRYLRHMTISDNAHMCLNLCKQPDDRPKKP